MLLKGTILAFAATLLLADATQVNHCDSGEEYEDSNQVTISNCDEPPCVLKKRTTVNIEQKIVPDHEIKSLVNSVHANLFNVLLPFIGVDGTDACQNIYNPDGSKAGCPLKAGQEYMYRNSFAVQPFYPSVALVVRYALMEGKKELTCFEAPSRIAN